MKKITLTILLITTFGLTACSEQQVNEWACGHQFGQERCFNLANKAYHAKEYDKLKKYLEISANYGNAKSQNALGALYETDFLGVKN